MADITVRPKLGIDDPKLQALARQVLGVFCLAGEKVVAHEADPATYPLRRLPSSVEAILQARFRFLPAPLQRRAMANVAASLSTPVDDRVRRYGEVARIDLSSPEPIEQLVGAARVPPELKLTADELARITPAKLARVRSGGASPARADRLWIRVHEVECVDETDGFLGNEAGEDEFYLGGTAIDIAGDAQAIGPHRIGDFNDGTSVPYKPPWRIVEFDLNKGDGTIGWPRTYFATFIPFEHDNGDLSEFENKLLDKAQEMAEEYVKGAVEAATVELGPIISWLAGELAEWIVGELFAWFRSMWEDEVFLPLTIKVEATLPYARFEGGKRSSPRLALHWLGYGGDYWIRFDACVRWSNDILSVRNELADRIDLGQGLRAATPWPASGSVRELIEGAEA
jgi:hypothetical protein